MVLGEVTAYSGPLPEAVVRCNSFAPRRTNIPNSSWKGRSYEELKELQRHLGIASPQVEH
jgi:hypothetical protein